MFDGLREDTSREKKKKKHFINEDEDLPMKALSWGASSEKSGADVKEAEDSNKGGDRVGKSPDGNGGSVFY